MMDDTGSLLATGSTLTVDAYSAAREQAVRQCLQVLAPAVGDAALSYASVLAHLKEAIEREQAAVLDEVRWPRV